MSVEKTQICDSVISRHQRRERARRRAAARADTIVLKNGRTVTEDDLLAYCKDRLVDYKVPRRIEFLDALPKTETGKIQRYVLRQADVLPYEPKQL